MISRLKELFSIQFLKFLVVGGISSVLNFAGGYLARYYIFLSASIVVGYICGTISSYFLNKIFTFEAKTGYKRTEIAKFIFTAIVSTILATIIGTAVVLLYNFLNLDLFPKNIVEDGAHLFAIGCITLFNYFMMKYFAFRSLGLLKRVMPEKEHT